jgi:hypothetical protein
MAPPSSPGGNRGAVNPQLTAFRCGLTRESNAAPMTTCGRLVRLGGRWPAEERTPSADWLSARDRLDTRALAALTLLATLWAVIVGGPAPAGRPAPSAEVVMADTGMAISDLVQVVRVAARDVPGSTPDRDLEIILVDEIPGADSRPFVGGLQRGSTVWVRVDLALPTRMLIHELAHAVTPGAEHGDRFRAVYLAVITEIYDETTALRETKRLAWVYDRCYADDSCPVS